MSDDNEDRGFPFSGIIGQDQLKLCLQLTYIEPRIGGVLISGERGTGKSTAVRAFSRMTTGKYPVTLPLSATEDRVVGGYEIAKAIEEGQLVESEGLIQEAARTSGIVYIDEVNLLEDHLVNILLDVASTGVLEVQREGRRETIPGIEIRLVGTMNPEEGSLRPQLRDRFGLMVYVEKAVEKDRVTILESVLGRHRPDVDDTTLLERLTTAKEKVGSVTFDDAMLAKCVRVAAAFDVDGHRGEIALARAATAHAAMSGRTKVTDQDLLAVAPLALMHRRPDVSALDQSLWNPAEDTQRVKEAIKRTA